MAAAFADQVLAGSLFLGLSLSRCDRLARLFTPAEKRASAPLSTSTMSVYFEEMAGDNSTSAPTDMEVDSKPLASISNELQLPWVEKYRPQKLEDLVSQDDIVSSITNLIDSDNLPHLLLYGPPGTGKTSTIVAAAKRMYGGSSAYSSMTLELNASDARGIDVVRNEIKEFAGTKQLFNKGIKLIILDEADAMTNDAQFALRRIIEKYTKNARFCLVCNYVSKIIPALQSRCTRFRFAPLSQDQIVGRLMEVVKAEGCESTKEGIDAILRLSGGDMRRVLNLLQSTAMSAKVVDQNSVYLTSGAPLPLDVDKIMDWLMNHKFQTACEQMTEMCTSKGYALTDVIAELTNRVLCLENLDSVSLGMLLDGMSNVEHRLAFGTDEKIQIASLVGVYVKTRESIEVK